jgi:hypothetical protein
VSPALLVEGRTRSEAEIAPALVIEPTHKGERSRHHICPTCPAADIASVRAAAHRSDGRHQRHNGHMMTPSASDADLYRLLAIDVTEPSEPRPDTVYTASIETIDNDRAISYFDGSALRTPTTGGMPRE